MNESGLIRQFWEYNEKEPLGAVVAALYLFLIEVWKKKGENDFRLSDTEICIKLKITRPTIIASRQKLCNFGMIQYQSQNGLPGHYKILQEYLPILSDFEKPEIEQEDSAKKTNQKKNPKKKTPTEKSTQEEENPQSQNLPSDDSLKTPIPTSVSDNIPSIEEFLEYAENLENYVPELEHLVTAKYDSWLKNSWKTVSDRPITNWKSSLKNTIPFLQSELQSGNIPPKEISLPAIKRPKIK